MTLLFFSISQTSAFDIHISQTFKIYIDFLPLPLPSHHLLWNLDRSQNRFPLFDVHPFVAPSLARTRPIGPMASNKSFLSGKALPLLLLCLLFGLFSSVGLALPQDGQPFVDYDTILTEHSHGKVPNIDKCRELITPPPRDSSMFYTGLRSNQEINIAKGYADRHGLAHVSKAYPEGFTNLLAYEDSPANLQQFQRDFMQVFAEKTTGTAYLIGYDGSEPRADSIFSTVELPVVQRSAQVDKIVRLPFVNPPDDPTTIAETIWTRPVDLPPYAPGKCRVHFTHYKIPHHGTSYSLEAVMYDGMGYEIGRQQKIDASEPVALHSKLPEVMHITVAQPTYHNRPDKAALTFQYGVKVWNSDVPFCDVGGYSHRNREGDCHFDC